MKKVYILSLLAGVFWFFLFYPALAGFGNFWLKISIAAGFLSFSALFFGKEDLKSLYRFEIKYIYIGIITAGLLYTVFYLGNYVSRILFSFAENQVSNIYLNKSLSSALLIAILLMFWIGPAEEIFWRGFIQKNLSDRFGKAKGYLLGVLVYSFIHIWAFNFMLFGAALVCGLFWGYIFMKYKSVWPGIISHAIWDVAVFILIPIT